MKYNADLGKRIALINKTPVCEVWAVMKGERRCSHPHCTNTPSVARYNEHNQRGWCADHVQVYLLPPEMQAAS